MDLITQRWLVIFVLALTCHSSESADPVPAVMCATGTFTSGTRAFITCFFNRDISVGHKYNFNVVQYTSSGASSGNHVVLCNWRADNDKECKVSDGYSYDQAVTDRLTVEIPEVSPSHTGLYACQILPADDIPVQTCVLNVTEPKATIPPPTVTTQLDETSKDDGTAAIIALAVILLIVLLLAAWAWVILILQSRRRNEKPADFFRSLLPCLKNGVMNRGAAQSVSDSASNGANRRSMAEMDRLLDMAQYDDSISVAPTVAVYGKQNLSDRQTQTPVVTKIKAGTQTLKKEQLPVKEWTEVHVREWLMEQTVGKYQTLIDKDVTGAQLLLLNHKDLLKKDWGLKGDEAEKLKESINVLITEDNNRQKMFAAAEQAEKDRQAAEKRQRDREAADRRDRDRQIAERRERDRQIAEQREGARKAAEQRDRDRQIAEQNERDRKAAELQEKDRLASQQREKDRQNAEQKEKDQRGRQEEKGGPTAGGGSSKEGRRRSRNDEV